MKIRWINRNCSVFRKVYIKMSVPQNCSLWGKKMDRTFFLYSVHRGNEGDSTPWK